MTKLEEKILESLKAETEWKKTGVYSCGIGYVDKWENEKLGVTVRLSVMLNAFGSKTEVNCEANFKKMSEELAEAVYGWDRERTKSRAEEKDKEEWKKLNEAFGV